MRDNINLTRGQIDCRLELTIIRELCYKEVLVVKRNGILKADRAKQEKDLDANKMDSLCDPTCQSHLTVIAAPVTLWEESRQQFTEWERPSEASSESIGEVLAHYRVEGIIGYGGMATVYRGFDPQLHRPVAIKVLHNHLARTGSSRQRFLREAQSAAAIAHPNVIPIHGVHQAAGKSFLVMPLIAGGSLQQRIDREGPLGLEDTLRIALQIAEALEAAHTRGVIHRDVKPANILLEDGNKRVVLSDFGLARTLDDASITASGLIAGAPAYMSPEQASGESVDHRTDLYSLGSVIYAMSTGHSPFQSTSILKLLREVSNVPFPTVHQFQEQLPEWVDGLIAQFTARDPAKRIANAGAAAFLIRDCMLHVVNEKNPLPKVVCRRSLRTASPLWLVSLSMLCAVLLVSSLVITNAFWKVNTGAQSQVVDESKSPLRSATTAESQERVQSVDANVWGSWSDPMDNEISQLKQDLERIIALEST